MLTNSVDRLPLGLQSFVKIRKGDFIYVDKTRLALNLAKAAGVYFLARPRRFGKSLFMDTLRNLFEGQRELFQGLHVEANWDWTIKYPVIKLDMSGTFNNSAALDIKLLNALENSAIELGVNLRGQDAAMQLHNLIIDVSRHYGQGVVLLIDEYDKPMIDNIDNLELARQMRAQLHGFYSIIKAADEHLRFTMLTGVSKFSKVSIFSGLNNLQDISLDPQYASVCGYTEGDLDGVFSEYLQGVDRELLCYYYNGYNFLGHDRVYNPCDILSFIKHSQSSGEFQFDNYWFETGAPTFIIDLLARNKVPAQQLEPQTVNKAKLESSPLENIDFTTALFQSGYLTIEELISSNIPGRNLYRLACPNQSVRSSLQDQLFSYYTTGGSTNNYQETLESALMLAEFSAIESELKRLFASIAADNYRKSDIARFEGYYASVVYSFFAGMGLKVTPEDVSNLGRVDLTIQLADKTYVIEFKVVKCQSDTNSALQQIIQRGYARKYSGKVYQIGIEFSEAERNVVGFAWQCA